MGMFDEIVVDRDDSRFSCTNAHSQTRFQTKDLGQGGECYFIGLGKKHLVNAFDAGPASIRIYAECRKCKEWVEFKLTFSKIQSIERVRNRV